MCDQIRIRLQKHLAAQGLDAVICLSPENFAYASGFVVPSQSLMRWRHAAVVVPASGEPAYFCVDMEESTVRAKINGAKYRAWGEFSDNAMQELAQLLREVGLESASIGIEMDFLSAGDFAELRSALPKAQFVAAEQDLARIRQIKTQGEVDLMRRLSRLADESIGNALEGVSPGDSEMDIAGGLTRSIYTLGADDFKLMIVATGERSVYPNVGPSLRPAAAPGYLSGRDFSRDQRLSCWRLPHSQGH